MAQQKISKDDVLRARILAPDKNFVALYLPIEFKRGALNFYSSSKRLFDSMNGIPADDGILAPAFMLYRQAVELILKSIFQRIHFGDEEVNLDLPFTQSLAQKYGHDLKKIHLEIEGLQGFEAVSLELTEPVRALVHFFSQEPRSSVALRYGGLSSENPEDSFSQPALVGELYRSWVSIYMFADAVVDSNLSRLGS